MRPCPKNSAIAVAYAREENRAEVIGHLRRLLPQLEGMGDNEAVVPFGIPRLDGHLPQGGLALGALHEIVPETSGDIPAAVGFVTALLSHMPAERPLLLVASRRGLAGCGRPCGHGLNALGLDPARLILVEAADDAEALWAMEEALRSRVPAAVAGAVGKGLDLRASQRLQLAARTAGVPLLLLRPVGALQPSAAATRWCIGADKAARDEFGLIARWRWRVRLERCRNGRSGEWLLEWDHGAHCFSLAPAVAGSAVHRSAGAQPSINVALRAAAGRS
jgi:protein ImuA